MFEADPGDPRSEADAKPDRSLWPVRRITLEEEGDEPYLRSLTPAERIAMVWPITLQAWGFKEGLTGEPRLRRDVVRVLRGRR